MTWPVVEGARDRARGDRRRDDARSTPGFQGAGPAAICRGGKTGLCLTRRIPSRILRLELGEKAMESGT